MGFSSNAIITVRNNRRLQRTPARTHWDDERLAPKRHDDRTQQPQRLWTPSDKKHRDNIRVGLALELCFVVTIVVYGLWRLS